MLACIVVGCSLFAAMIAAALPLRNHESCEDEDRDNE